MAAEDELAGREEALKGNEEETLVALKRKRRYGSRLGEVEREEKRTCSGVINQRGEREN